MSLNANRLAASATNHCLTGCGIGEVLGMVLATWWGWGNAASIALAVALADVFGYSLTLIPLLRAGTQHRAANGIALSRPDGAGCQVVLRVCLVGPAAEYFGQSFGPAIAAGLPRTGAALVAESQSVRLS